MRRIEVALEEDIARALAVEADLLEFEDLTEYVRWVVDNRFAIEADGRRGRQLSVLDERTGEPDADARAAALAASARATDDHVIDGDVERVARVEDEELAVAAETLSSVEDNRLDRFARQAIEQTRERLGDSLASGIEYDATAAGSDRDRPGEEVTDLDDIDVPGTGERLLERRRRAVGAAVAYLREVAEAKRSDFLEELYEEFPAGYDSESGWWECIKTGLRQVDRVDPAGSGSRIWRYRTTAGRVTRISFPK